MAKELKGTVKEILGTAFSVGCTVNNKSPMDIQEAIQDGMSPHLLVVADPAVRGSHSWCYAECKKQRNLFY